MNTIKTVIILGIIAMSNLSCSNTKNISHNFTYLATFLSDADYHNRYIFIDNYVPSVMKRKGFDYADAHQSSQATDNFFNFEGKAIDRYHGISELFPINTTFFRCLYINETGRIAHSIKRKITVNQLHSQDFTIVEKGTNRLYDRKPITPQDLVQKIISSEEFTYHYFEKKDEKEVAYEIVISNDTSSDWIYNSLGEVLCANIPFHHAEFIYDDKGKFIDLRIIE